MVWYPTPKGNLFIKMKEKQIFHIAIIINLAKRQAFKNKSLMKFYLFFVLILFTKITFGQTYSSFFWGDDKSDFKSVKLNVKDLTTKKTIFNGYKESQITIRQSTVSDPTYSDIYAKIGGYLELSSSKILSFKYIVENELTTIQYGATYENGVALITFYYTEYTLKKISVLTSKNSKKEIGSNLSFELEGFE